jgi:hypothetical protein
MVNSRVWFRGAKKEDHEPHVMRPSQQKLPEERIGKEPNWVSLESGIKT